MLSVLLFAVNAVFPILLLVVLGYALKRRGLFTIPWLQTANRFNFRYCLMALMFYNIYSLEGLKAIQWNLAGFVLVSLGTMTLLGYWVARCVTSVRNRRGVLMQVIFRSNFAIIGLPLVESLGDPAGPGLAAAMQAPAVIYFNIMAVTVLSFYSEGNEKVNWRKTLSGILHNPLIRGLGLGIIALVLRAVLPKNGAGAPVFSLSRDLPWLYSAISSLAQIGTPFALVVLGGQFEFGEMRGVGRELIWGVAGRLLLAPAVGCALTYGAVRLGWLELTPAVVAVLVALFATPVAVSSSVMASEMGGDDVLAGQLVVWTTFGSLFTLFGIIAALRFVGLL